MAVTRIPPVRRTTQLGVLAALAGLMALALAGPAHASSPPAAGYGAGPNYCSKYSGGKNAGPSYANIYACNGTTKGDTTFDSPGAGYYAWQCVELSARFLWAIHGIWAGPGSGVQTGADLVMEVNKNHPSIPVATPSPSSVPAAGDVMSFGPGGGSDPNVGHTAVVITNTAANGKFTIMSENDPENSAGTQVLTVDKAGKHNGYVLFNGSWTSARWLVLTSPTTAQEIAFQANTGTLWSTGVGGDPSHHEWGKDMMAGTSPSIARISNGQYEVAFQANTGNLSTVNLNTGVTTNWPLAMMKGTSPSIASYNGNFEVAYQASNGNLATMGSSQHGQWGLGMMKGTSPAITAISNGTYEVAFQANTGNLYTLNSAAGASNLNDGMMAATSPAITRDGNGYEIAFQANTSDLYTVGGGGDSTHGNWKLGMMKGTSPSISSNAQVFQVAFQANTGSLYTVNASSGNTNWQLGMMASTSPSIVADASGFEIAFQANNGDLYTVGSGGDSSAHNLNFGMAKRTSPAIAP